MKKEVEEDIFGTSSEFSIDTKYAGRDPDEISDDEILLDRTPPRTKVVFSIDDAVDYAIAHSREFQSRKESLYLTALNLTGERYEFFPQAERKRPKRPGGWVVGPELGWRGFTPAAPGRPMSNTVFLGLWFGYYWGK